MGNRHSRREIVSDREHVFSVATEEDYIPMGLCIVNNTLYIVDRNNDKIRECKITMSL
jgi:hypothetical protein